jgi:hypothetical protein
VEASVHLPPQSDGDLCSSLHECSPHDRPTSDVQNGQKRKSEEAKHVVEVNGELHGDLDTMSGGVGHESAGDAYLRDGSASGGDQNGGPDNGVDQHDEGYVGQSSGRADCGSCVGQRVEDAEDQKDASCDDLASESAPEGFCGDRGDENVDRDDEDRDGRD